MAARSRVTPSACRMRGKYTQCAKSRPERSLRSPLRSGSTEYDASRMSLRAPDRTVIPADRQIAAARNWLPVPMRLGGPFLRHLSLCSARQACEWPTPARILQSPSRISRPSQGGASWRSLVGRDWTTNATGRRIAPVRAQLPVPRCLATPVLLSPQAWTPRRGYDGRRSATCGSRCGPDLRNSDRRGYCAKRRVQLGLWRQG